MHRVRIGDGIVGVGVERVERADPYTKEEMVVSMVVKPMVEFVPDTSVETTMKPMPNAATEPMRNAATEPMPDTSVGAASKSASKPTAAGSAPTRFSRRKVNHRETRPKYGGRHTDRSPSS